MKASELYMKASEPYMKVNELVYCMLTFICYTIGYTIAIGAVTGFILCTLIALSTIL
jgi:hypothetical protein